MPCPGSIFIFRKGVQRLPIAYKNYGRPRAGDLANTPRALPRQRFSLSTSSTKKKRERKTPRAGPLHKPAVFQNTPQSSCISASRAASSSSPLPPGGFFGLVATPADAQKSLPTLQPARDNFSIRYLASRLQRPATRQEKTRPCSPSSRSGRGQDSMVDD